MEGRPENGSHGLKVAKLEWRCSCRAQRLIVAAKPESGWGLVHTNDYSYVDKRYPTL